MHIIFICALDNKIGANGDYFKFNSMLNLQANLKDEYV